MLIKINWNINGREQNKEFTNKEDFFDFRDKVLAPLKISFHVKETYDLQTENQELITALKEINKMEEK